MTYLKLNILFFLFAFFVLYSLYFFRIHVWFRYTRSLWLFIAFCAFLFIPKYIVNWVPHKKEKYKIELNFFFDVANMYYTHKHPYILYYISSVWNRKFVANVMYSLCVCFIITMYYIYGLKHDFSICRCKNIRFAYVVVFSLFDTF